MPVFCALLLGAVELAGEERSKFVPRETDRFVRAYEPIYVGYTVDEGDQPFMDFSLSVMFPGRMLFPFFMSEEAEAKFPDTELYWEALKKRSSDNALLPRVYAAFNGRAGQYIGTRQSSPVFGKRFNPLLALRWWQHKEGEYGLEDYFEISYGHESNGQRLGSGDRGEGIDWEARYFDLRNDYFLTDGEPSIARDEISRGWDYVGIRWSDSWSAGRLSGVFMAEGKYFLSNGILQGDREDYYEWENEQQWLELYDGEIVLHKFDGLRALVRFSSDGNEDQDLTLSMRTGYKGPFERLTFRVEYRYQYYTIWYRNGYNSDFVNYYHKDESFGIALKIRQF